MQSLLATLEATLFRACSMMDDLVMSGTAWFTLQDMAGTSAIGAARKLGAAALPGRASGAPALPLGVWERRLTDLLPLMERGARCGSAYMVVWQPTGRAASNTGGSAAAARSRRCACPLPAVQHVLALAGVACANPRCTRQKDISSHLDEASEGRLQLCRGCRVAGYCW